MTELRPYQTEIVDKILMIPKVGVFADMGLGKSACTIKALQILMYPRTLIIAPKLVAMSTWPQEFLRWDSAARVTLIAGTPKKRAEKVLSVSDVFIISRDNVEWLVKTFKNIHYDVIVLDESSSFKNFTAKRTRAVKQLCKTADRVIELTGTPASNGYGDLFSQIFLLDGGQRLGKSVTRFREEYMSGPVINGHKIYNKMKKGSEEKINELIKDITFSLKSCDYLQLPDRVDSFIKLSLDDSTRRDYERLKNDYVLRHGNEVITVANAAVMCGKLACLANGFIYNDDKEVIEFSRHKLERLKEIIDVSTENILVFAVYQRDITEIEKLGAVKLDSSSKIEMWQRGEIKVGVAQPASLAYGVNLQSGGRTVIWYSCPYSLEQYQQANKRLHRSGVKGTVSIIHMITEDTIDIDIYKSLQNKTLTQDSLLNMCKLHMT